MRPSLLSVRSSPACCLTTQFQSSSKNPLSLIRNSKMHTSTSQPRISRFANDAQKAGGDISDAFSSFSGGPKSDLPLRYSQLKKNIVPTQRDQDALVSSWKEVLGEVQSCVANVRRLGGSVSNAVICCTSPCLIQMLPTDHS